MEGKVFRDPGQLKIQLHFLYGVTWTVMWLNLNKFLQFHGPDWHSVIAKEVVKYFLLSKHWTQCLSQPVRTDVLVCWVYATPSTLTTTPVPPLLSPLLLPFPRQLCLLGAMVSMNSGNEDDKSSNGGNNQGVCSKTEKNREFALIFALLATLYRILRRINHLGFCSWYFVGVLEGTNRG